MRALTITQPWAGLVASGIKLVENRSRSVISGRYIGEQFAIHASREIDERVYDRIVDIAPELADAEGIIWRNPTRNQPWVRLSEITSAVIAVATLDDVVKPAIGEGFTVGVHAELSRCLDEALPGQGRWFFGPIGYVLRDVRALATPVPCRGWQGFWTLPDDVERAVRAQLAEAA